MFKKITNLFKPENGLSVADNLKLKGLATIHALTAIKAVPSDSNTRSKIGGAPRVTTDFVWPQNDGNPLAFLCQFDLAEIRKVAPIEWLPQSGMLSFYYDAVEQPWGFDPKDKGGWLVHYDPADTPLSLITLPVALDDEVRFDEQHLNFALFDSMPNSERILHEHEHDPDDEDFWEAYNDVQYATSPPIQIGGYPVPVQSDGMELQCQLVSNGIYCGDATGYESDAAKELSAGAGDWQLLLQLDSDDDAMKWGDNGRLYFWIRLEDARRADFSKVLVVLQCY